MILDDYDNVILFCGDAIEHLRTIPDNFVDSVVTDPPYGLEFMGKDWDSFKPSSGKWGDRESRPTITDADDTPHHRAAIRQPAVLSKCQRCGGNNSGQRNRCECENPEFRKPTWPLHNFQFWCQAWAEECLRVLKPGGHLLAFGGSRTFHRLACAIEDAGFEIRDSISWLYGSGFPKSMDVSKAIDKAAGEKREVIGSKRLHGNALVPTSKKGGTYGVNAGTAPAGDVPITAPATPDAEHWQGWGTALKPAWEPIIVARKPLIGTVAANVLEHGTGALNIDVCRVPMAEGSANPSIARRKGATNHLSTEKAKDTEARGKMVSRASAETYSADHAGEELGRWPSNVLLDESQAAELDSQTGHRRKDSRNKAGGAALEGSADGSLRQQDAAGTLYGDTGGASRYFPTFKYQAKAPKKERPTVDGISHPTVKPLELMRWLVKLVTPPGGTVLDPFAGSGTTGEAALLEGMSVILIEKTEDYFPLIEERLRRVQGDCKGWNRPND